MNIAYCVAEMNSQISNNMKGKPVTQVKGWHYDWDVHDSLAVFTYKDFWQTEWIHSYSQLTVYMFYKMGKFHVHAFNK